MVGCCLKATVNEDEKDLVCFFGCLWTFETVMAKDLDQSQCHSRVTGAKLHTMKARSKVVGALELWDGWDISLAFIVRVYYPCMLLKLCFKTGYSGTYLPMVPPTWKARGKGWPGPRRSRPV